MTSVSVGILPEEKAKMGLDLQEVYFGELLMKDKKEPEQIGRVFRLQYDFHLKRKEESNDWVDYCSTVL